MDRRFDYREVRRCALGLLAGRVIYVAYVDRNQVRRIISLRKANAREVLKYVQGKE
ncbi:MAG TPA: BrnT family toxin [Pseudoduganella sp.]